MSPIVPGASCLDIEILQCNPQMGFCECTKENYFCPACRNPQMKVHDASASLYITPVALSLQAPEHFLVKLCGISSHRMQESDEVTEAEATRKTGFENSPSRSLCSNCQQMPHKSMDSACSAHHHLPSCFQHFSTQTLRERPLAGQVPGKWSLTPPDPQPALLALVRQYPALFPALLALVRQYPALWFPAAATAGSERLLQELYLWGLPGVHPAS